MRKEREVEVTGSPFLRILRNGDSSHFFGRILPPTASHVPALPPAQPSVLSKTQSSLYMQRLEERDMHKEDLILAHIPKASKCSETTVFGFFQARDRNTGVGLEHGDDHLFLFPKR